MTEAPKAELEMSLEDEEADPLFEKADALIQRHASFAIEPELDDLPVLTDVVETLAAALDPLPAAEPNEPGAPLPDLAPATTVAADADRLGVLDMAINQHIQDWVATELPQLVSRELDDLAERLQAAAASHLRATLLPLISSEIAETFSKGPEP